MKKETLNAIMLYVNNLEVFAIVKALSFYENIDGIIVRSEDFVVCKWHDYHDGTKSNIEGRTTIAICREFSDAILIFNSKIKI